MHEEHGYRYDCRYNYFLKTEVPKDEKVFDSFRASPTSIVDRRRFNRVLNEKLCLKMIARVAQ